MWFTDLRFYGPLYWSVPHLFGGDVSFPPHRVQGLGQTPLPWWREGEESWPSRVRELTDSTDSVVRPRGLLQCVSDQGPVFRQRPTFRVTDPLWRRSRSEEGEGRTLHSLGSRSTLPTSCGVWVRPEEDVWFMRLETGLWFYGRRRWWRSNSLLLTESYSGLTFVLEGESGSRPFTDVEKGHRKKRESEGLRGVQSKSQTLFVQREGIGPNVFVGHLSTHCLLLRGRVYSPEVCERSRFVTVCPTNGWKRKGSQTS